MSLSALASRAEICASGVARSFPHFSSEPFALRFDAGGCFGSRVAERLLIIAEDLLGLALQRLGAREVVLDAVVALAERFGETR
jgi:hypothetical protein